MRRAPMLAAVAALLVSAVAVAEYTKIEAALQWFKAGLFIGPGATASASNKLKNSLGSPSTDKDIASINAATCLDTALATVTGAAVGDTCALGFLAPAPTANLSYECFVSAANTVTVRACNPTAAPIDPADAGFRVRTFASP